MAKIRRTWEEILARSNDPVPKRHQNDLEHRIQVACVNWFRYAHHDMYGSLFAIGNGGKRDAVTGAKLKAEGVLAGVADLILLERNGKHNALAIEMKTPKGSQSPAQKEWQAYIETRGVKYVICRSLDEFIEEIESYIKQQTIQNL